MARSTFSRRRWMQTSAALLGGAAAASPWNLTSLLADEPKAAAPTSTVPLNRFPRMVHDHFVTRAREIVQVRREVMRAIRSKESAEGYIRIIRQEIQQSFGPWPERTPLNPQITGIVERDTYRIEKVIFESRPQFFVTANLYVPKGLTGKAPAVVGSCGHSSNGKAAETYQSFAQGLVRQGYVVLIFDPIGQGERLQLPTPEDAAKSRVGIGVREHMMVGNQQFLVGEFFGSWRAWDGIRALDYLLTRDEVDPKHVGITGNSGGGTMSTWLCGVEDRWTMAAPSCFVTSFLNNLENELPADTEQCPPRALGEGLDHGDFLLAMAPKPIIIIGQERDFFDVRGLTETYEDLRHIYKLLGAEENVAMFIGANDHGYHQDGREAMYAHFNKATGRGDGPVKEPAMTMETDATLQCTKTGQVAVDLKSRPVYSFTKDTAEALAKSRGNPSGEQLSIAASASLGISTRIALTSGDGHRSRREHRSDKYGILRPRRHPDYPLPFLTTFLVDIGRLASVPVYRLYETSNVSRPPKLEGPAVLYVAHDSSEVELRTEPLIREVWKSTPATLYACDVSGLGESRPNTCGENSYATPYGCDYFYASHAIMLGTSYLSLRVGDISLALDFISKQGGHRSIHLVAKGYGTLAAAFAALGNDDVTHVTLKNPLTSFHDIACAEVYEWPLSALLPGVLKHFDLPDVYRELKKTKQLRLIDPVGPDAKFGK